MIDASAYFPRKFVSSCCRHSCTSAAAPRLHHRSGMRRQRRPAEEWEKYLEQTLRHVDILTGACAAMGLDPDADDAWLPDRSAQRQGLVIAMKMARPRAISRPRSSSPAIAWSSRRPRTTPIGN